MNDDVLRELTLLRDLGYTHLDLTGYVQSIATPAAIAPSVAARPMATANDSFPETPFLETLDAVAREAHVCTACRLAATRTHVVFGVGSPTADLIVANDVKDASIEFDSDQNVVLIIAGSDGSATRVSKSAKSEVANRLLDVIVARLT